MNKYTMQEIGGQQDGVTQLTATPVNNPAGYETLTDAEREALQAWIERELVPATRTGRYSTYGLKHIFEGLDGGFYVTNGQMKGAMLAARFEPVDRDELNWEFRYELRDRLLWERSVGRA